MPKVVSSSSRRLRALPSCQEHPSHSSILLTAPRKVSFEDGHQSSASFGSSASCSVTASTSTSTSSSSIASSMTGESSCSKSSLRRKAPSVCLVGLAEQQDRDCLSPVPSTDGPAAEAPSSPWGHFVDILVPMDAAEESQQPSHKRRLGESPLFYQRSYSSDSSSPNPPTFSPLAKKHKQHRRAYTSLHPYGLQPRHQRRRRNRSNSEQLPRSFLPGFFLESPPPAPLDRISMAPELPSSTKEVETALRRLQV